jgi:hypothetical protein
MVTLTRRCLAVPVWHTTTAKPAIEWPVGSRSPGDELDPMKALAEGYELPYHVFSRDLRRRGKPPEHENYLRTRIAHR